MNKQMKSEFLHILEQRGFIHQCSDIEALDTFLCQNGPVSAYIGFDPTASSLHAGSLTQIMILRWFQKMGHRPVILIGGGTALIGDPSGKDKQRQMLDAERIQKNSQGITKIFSTYIKFGTQPCEAVIHDNVEWLSGLAYLDFLRRYGIHFSVNRMLGFDSVRLRLEREQPLSFLEFNYMVLQAYDFFELYKRSACRLQIGGSDQWGNIICGIDLARRIDGVALYGLTSPLLTTSSGEKMGKTANGALWLDKERTSPYEFWQYWRNCEDQDIEKFLKLFTELPMDEIKKLGALKGAEINDAKKILATEMTRLCHGKEEAEKTANAAKNLFEAGIVSADMPEFHLPCQETPKAAFELFHQIGLAETKSAARRLIRGGGAKINDRTIQKEDEIIALQKEAKDDKVKLSAGKKRHKIIILDP